MKNGIFGFFFAFVLFAIFTNLKFFDRGFDSFFGQLRNDEILSQGEDALFHVNVANRLDDDDNSGFEHDLEDVKARIFIPQLGEVLTTNSFDVDDMDNTGKSLILNTKGIESGEYLVRFSISNDDFREVKYRYITIDNS